MAALRIFSYLPNPRVWKATIAARFCGVDIEIRGGPPQDLRNWVWDYDARPIAERERELLLPLARAGRVGLTGAKLFKTDAFLEAQPFGNVPAAFGRDGKIGIFESNSIMRAVARLGEASFPLYGRDLWEASRVDSFLDVSLVFARELADLPARIVGRHGGHGNPRARQAGVCDLCLGAPAGIGSAAKNPYRR